MFLSLLRQVILLIPCLLILPNVPGLNGEPLGLTGIWLSGAISDGLSSLITLVIFYNSVKKLNRNKEVDCEEELSIC